jgi:hypothetical protein
MSSGIRVGRWDCSTCGHKGILGPETKCPNCGAARGKNVTFYLPDDEAEVTDDAKLSEAKAGADWVCDFCGADNKAKDTSCLSCGNPRDKSDTTRQEKVILDNEPPPTPAVTAAAKPRTRSKGPYIVAGVAVLLIGVLFFLFRERTISVTVMQHSWKRQIDTEKYIPVTEEDWHVPSGGAVLSSFNAIHHYDQVFVRNETRYRTVQKQTGTKRVRVGKRSKGNGYFEDVYENQPVYTSSRESYQEPVYASVPRYATKYRYKINKWVAADAYPTSGTTKSATWATPPPNTTTFREKERHETYTLHYQDPRDNQYQEDVPFDVWNGANDGDKLPAQKNAFRVRLKEHNEK